MPRTEIAAQESAYRRGLLLGFTMAEMVLLIIFALLLAMGTALYARESAVNAAQRARRAAEQMLAEVRTSLARTGYSTGKIDDLFRELKLATETRRALEEARARLAEAEHKAALLDKLIRAVDPQAPPDSSVEEQQKLLERAELQRIAAEAIADIARTEMPQQPLPTTTAEQRAIIEVVKGAFAAAHEAEQKIITLRGQNRALQNKLGDLGKGVEMPPCWADEASGKPEYIFDVTLTSTGLVIKNNALSHRAKEQAQLPLGNVGFGREVSPAQFLEQMRPLYEWSKREECRFFVRVVDGTGPSEKTIYKRHLRTVWERFYLFEPR